jgi:hypothetical protein
MPGIITAVTLIHILYARARVREQQMTIPLREVSGSSPADDEESLRHQVERGEPTTGLAVSPPEAEAALIAPDGQCLLR